MKRKTRGLASERCKMEEVTDDTPENDEKLVDIVQKLEDKVQEQDEKISQLFEANKEMKTA